MVEVYFGVDPRVVFFEALRLVIDLWDGKPLSILVHALVELPSEKLDPHDRKYQPEDQTHQKHIDDGRDCIHQGIDNNLQENVLKNVSSGELHLSVIFQ